MPDEPSGRRPRGVALLAAFLATGALICALAALSLTPAGAFLEPMWRVNPAGQAGLSGLGAWGPLLMVTVGAACAAAAVGLWRAARWGYWLTIGIFVANLVGDVANALVRAQWAALIGIPIVAAIVLYLRRDAVRRYFGFATPG
jgi:uncharacterized membrane protein (DUF2068 family)